MKQGVWYKSALSVIIVLGCMLGVHGIHSSPLDPKSKVNPSLSPIEQCLDHIKAEVGESATNDTVVDCLELIREKTCEIEASLTGSLLEELRDQLQSVTSIFSEVVEALLQSLTIFEDLQMTSSELVIVIEDILTLFDETFTAIDEVQQTACEKFEQTWTALDEVQQAVDDFVMGSGGLGEQCFQETFTALEELNNVLCDKFAATWTALAPLVAEAEEAAAASQEALGSVAAIQPKVDDLVVTTSDGCLTIKRQFEETWTTIEQVKNAVPDVPDEFDQTFTALDELVISACEKFDQTFTVIQQLEDSLNEIVQDFDATFTALDQAEQQLCQKFDATFTALDKLSQTVDATNMCVSQGGADNFSGTWTTIDQIQEGVCDKFVGTWTALDDTTGDLSSLFSDVVTLQVSVSLLDAKVALFKTTFTNSVEDVEDQFEQTWTLLDATHDKVCDIQDSLSVFVVIVEDINELNELIINTNTFLEVINEVLMNTETIVQSILDSTTALIEIVDMLVDDFDMFNDTMTLLEAKVCELAEGVDGTFTALADTENVLCSKFHETWTALADAEQQTLANIQESFNGTFTALEDLEASLCSKFDQTFTIITQLESDVQANQLVVDVAHDQFVELFDQTFTALEGTDQRLCDKFQDTFTLIASVVESIKASLNDEFDQTFTAIDELEQNQCRKFQETWTLLEGTQNSLNDAENAQQNGSQNAVRRFDQTFTVLDALDDALCDKFEQTWTAIADIQNNTSDVLLEEFQHVWTALDAVQSDVCQKFYDTWTILEGIVNTVGTVEDTVDQDALVIADQFEATWTALDSVIQEQCEKFEGTWTILASIEQELSDIVEDEFGATWTALEAVKQTVCDKFEATWTVLSGIQNSLDALGMVEFEALLTQTVDLVSIFTSLENIVPTMCEKFEETWTILACLQGVTPISGPTTISVPGVYCLVNDISVTSGDGIVIDADNVILDLQGKTIASTAGIAVGIEIESSRKNIQISNGTVRGFGIGIDATGLSGQEVTKVVAQDICVRECGLALNLRFVDDSQFKNFLITECTSLSSDLIFFDECDRLTFEDATIVGNGGTFTNLLRLQDITCSVFKNLKIQSNPSTNLARGIITVRTVHSTFEDILICDEVFSLVSFGTGFDLATNSTNNKITRVVMRNITNDSTTAILTGFSASGVNDNIFRDCLVQGLRSIANRRVSAYNIVGSRNTFVDCVAQDITGLFATTARIIGFAVPSSGTTDNVFCRCIAKNVLAGASIATPGASGFFIDSASSSDHNVFDLCQAIGCRSEVDAQSFGFYSRVTPGFSDESSYSRCIAANNGSLIGNQFFGNLDKASWNVSKGLDADIPSGTTPYHSLGIITSCTIVPRDLFDETFTAIEEVQIILCDKFEQTWTMLAAINDNLSEIASECAQSQQSLSSIFTVIDGIEQTVCSKFEQTWTQLDAVMLEQGLGGFQETWTAIDELNQTLCDKFDLLNGLLQGTATLIDTATTNKQQQVTTICMDSNETFTVLDEVEQSVCSKFEQTWTLIDTAFNDVEVNTLPLFEQTWTAIEEVGENLCPKFDMLNAELLSLADAIDSVTAVITLEFTNTIVAGFEQTWTAIDEQEEIVCPKFEQTWTALDATRDAIVLAGALLVDKINQTFTALDELTDDLCDKFEQTWTQIQQLEDIVAAIELNVTITLDDTFTVLDALEDELCSKFEGTWTILDQITDDIPLSEQTTISSPGVYCMTNNIDVTSGDGVTIASGDVVIKMNGYTLSGPTTGAGFCINAGLTNITIKDGFINGFATGIRSKGTLGNEVEKVRLDTICITETEGEAIFADYTDHSLLHELSIVDCVQSTTAAVVVFQNCKGTEFTDSRISDNSQDTARIDEAVVLVDTCSCMIFNDLQMHENGINFDSNGDSSVFKLIRSPGCKVAECVVIAASQSTGAATNRHAFWITDGSHNMVMRNCSILIFQTFGSFGTAAEFNGFFIEDSDNCLLDRCIANLVAAAAPALSAFRIQSNNNTLIDCLALRTFVNFGLPAASDMLTGFRVGPGAIANSFIRCIANNPDGTDSVSRVSGFFIESDGPNLFYDCSANNSEGGDPDEFGFIQSSAGGTNAYSRCTALNNGTDINHSFEPSTAIASLPGPGTRVFDDWVTKKTAASGYFPLNGATITRSHSLGAIT